MKADALSRNDAASHHQPESEIEDKIYSLFSTNKKFSTQLLEEQSIDPLIQNALQHIRNNTKCPKGGLKRVQHQLRIKNKLLTKSGRPIVPPSLRKIVVREYHDIAHFGTDKIYNLLKNRFYWPNMYHYVQQCTEACETCQRTKGDTHPPKAPLVKMFIPNSPMQFILIDIAYLPIDNSGFKYMLLIGDIFSKCIATVPVKDHTASSVVTALLHNWIYVHRVPSYLLSDQGCNVDGHMLREICNTLGIKKRRSSADHRQGNRFAERNIRTVKDMLRAALLHRRLAQVQWRNILPPLVFALNTSISQAAHCVPYNVAFGQTTTLPQDIVFGGFQPDPFKYLSVNDYQQELPIMLSDIYKHAIETLEISKRKMQ